MELRPYQLEALRFMQDRGRSIYADAPGTGKTPTTLTWLEQQGWDRSIIVAPKPVLDHWQAEAEVWAPTIQIIRGDGSAAKRGRAREALPAEGPVALLLNFEAMRQDVEDLMDLGWNNFVVDEAHRLKGRSTLVTRAARRIARRSDRVALLTGTPIMNRADELWSLLNLLAPEEHTSYWRFVRRYFDVTQEWFSGRLVEMVGEVREDRLEELRELVHPTLIHRSLDECLPNLAEAVQVPYPVRLSAQERKLYQQMEQHKWADLGEGRVLSASTDLAQITRLRQMASNMAGVLGEDYCASKARATVDLVKELEGEQVVVLTAYKHTARAIADSFDLGEAVLYTGDESQEQRGRALSSFVSGGARVMVGTLATLGEGVDGLQVARYIVMVDRDWTPARNEQAVARLRRSGQDRTVVVYQVFAEGTIDEMVADTIMRKDLRIAEVLGDSANGWDVEVIHT